MNDNKDDTIGGLFNRGLAVRREVLGASYVDNSISAANDFMMTFQHITTDGAGATPGRGPASIARLAV